MPVVLSDGHVVGGPFCRSPSLRSSRSSRQACNDWPVPPAQYNAHHLVERRVDIPLALLRREHTADDKRSSVRHQRDGLRGVRARTRPSHIGRPGPWRRRGSRSPRRHHVFHRRLAVGAVVPGPLLRVPGRDLWQGPRDSPRGVPGRRPRHPRLRRRSPTSCESILGEPVRSGYCPQQLVQRLYPH